MGQLFNANVTLGSDLQHMEVMEIAPLRKPIYFRDQYWQKCCQSIKEIDFAWWSYLWNVDYSIESIVNNIILAMHGAKWVLEALGEPLYQLHDFLATMLYICMVLTWY